jgi:hypothetical protein
MQVESLKVFNAEYFLREYVPASVAMDWIDKYLSKEIIEQTPDAAQNAVFRVSKQYTDWDELAPHVLCDKDGKDFDHKPVPLHHIPKLMREIRARLHVKDFMEAFMEDLEKLKAEREEAGEVEPAPEPEKKRDSVTG